ncbi:MAG TPA: hypothetical protein VNA04_16935 [Thermoanaerobaculia bacterium]|nr:hypothetical protein [Thermoanaerobaculia bacterium]
MLRSALRFAAGAAAGILLWLYVTPTYHVVLVAAAEPLMRADPRLRHAEVLPSHRRITARGGTERPELPAVLIPADQLTYNVILFLGLFATNPAPFRDRGVRRLAIALAILFATHALAVVAAIEATYATGTGPWGDRNYAPMEQDFWVALEYGYRLAGMFGIAFGCWWMTRQSAAVSSQEAI